MMEIKTNYKKGRYSYPMCNGEERNGYTMKLREFRESIDDFYKRLVESGYTTISFYEVSTRVRGLHNTIAYVKR